MKLWLLEPRDWRTYSGGYTYSALVIRAENEHQAYEIAALANETDVWRDPEVISCTEITSDGEADMVIGQYDN